MDKVYTNMDKVQKYGTSVYKVRIRYIFGIET